MVANLFQRARTSQETGKHTGLPRKPFIGDRAAIAKGYQDYLDTKEDNQPAPESNADNTSEPKEIPQGQGMTSTEPFGDQAGTDDWDGGGIDSESQPEKVVKNEDKTSQSAANRMQAASVAKIEALRAIPNFYQVQDKTGRVKFNSGSIEALVETYEQITSNDGDGSLSKLTASQRDILEMAWKLKHGEYKSIDQLSEDITLCANIEEDPSNFKANFESIASALGVTSDSQKRLFDLSNYNNKKLNTEVETTSPENLPVQPTAGTPATDKLKEVDPDQEDRPATPNTQASTTTTHVGSTPTNLESELALNKIEGALTGNTKPAGQSKNQLDQKPVENFGKLGEKITQKDIDALEVKLKEFIEIQTKGKLTDEQLDTFIALASLKGKGWSNINYKDIPTNLLSLTEYDKKPEGEIPVTHKRTDIPELRVPEPKMFDTVEDMLAYMRSIKESQNPVEQAAGEAMETVQKEVGVAQGEIANTVPAIRKVGENTMKQALDGLGVLGIPAEDAVSRVAALAAMGYTDPNKVLQLTDQTVRDEDIQVPGFLRREKVARKSLGEMIFGKERNRTRVGGFVDKFKDWWGNKKWDRARVGSISGTSDEALTITSTAFILLALLGLNNLKEEKGAEVATTETTNPEKPVSANPQIFDDVPNPYPSAFEGQTIYPDMPNVSVPEIGTDGLSQYTQVTPEMVRACQAGNNSYLINCIKAVAGSQTKELRTELVGIIGEAAKKRATSEGRDWSKLTANERNAYADAVLGGDKNSPAGKIAKKLGLDQKDYTFTGMDDLKKMGIKVALPEKPKSIPMDIVISEIKAMKK